MATAAFSRLQLAAALLEYDNDPEDPNAPYRTAEESAIFMHLRGVRDPRKEIMKYYAVEPEPAPRRSIDHLGVTLPSDKGSTLGAIDPKHHELDLNRPVESTRPARSMEGRRSVEAARSIGGRRSMETGYSMGARRSMELFRNPSADERYDDEYSGDEEEQPELELDLSSWGVDALLTKEKKQDPVPRPRSRAASEHLTDGQRGPSPAPSVPLAGPSRRRQSGARSLSLGNWGEGGLESPRQSQDRPPEARARRSSLANPLNVDRETTGPVQFDRERRQSVSAVPFPQASSPAQDEEEEQNPFAIPLPSPANTSRFDPKVASHARTMSNASLGSRIMLEDHQSEYGQSTMTPYERSETLGQGRSERRERNSRMALLRPKVLIMPSPLQDAEEKAQEKRPERAGFEHSIDGPPLPPGARTVRPGNSFTPNPRNSMSLAQLTFRNSLMVGGQRDVAYTDLNESLRRAQEEGEKIEWEPEEPEPEPEVLPESEPQRGRPAGKLYGKSLMDDLEARKAEMRGKRRVFTGDQRPSMMQRGQPRGNSTFIDGDALKQGTASQMMANDSRRNSKAPLLNFNDNGNGLPQTKSVFGVDQIWERELAKLKELEAADKEAEEEERRREEKRSKKKGKKSGKASEPTPPTTLAPPANAPGRVSIDPPVLPNVPTLRGKPQPSPGSDSDDDRSPARPRQSTAALTSKGWASSDDEAPNAKQRAMPEGARERRHVESESEDDVPLASQLRRSPRKKRRSPRKQRPQSDSEDESEPLSRVLQRKTGVGLPPINFDSAPLASITKPTAVGTGDDDDDDEKPLGLRHPNAARSQLAHEEDEDETPLGLKVNPYEQQRRQQQMMMQQQLMMQTPMAFAPNPMLGPQFPFGPPSIASPMQMMVPPQAMFNAQPAHDAAKLSRVDRWRRGVSTVEPERP